MNLIATRRTTGTVLGLVLFLGASAFAQQIPYDYFYGRIVGRQQVGLDYRDSEGARATIDGSLYFGFRDRFRFGVDKLFRWTPSLSDDALHWNQPPLRGDIQLADGLRLHHDLFRLDQNSSFDLSGNAAIENESDELGLSQSLNYLESAGVEYDPDLSLREFLGGIWLNKSQSQAQGSWDFDFMSQKLSRNDPSSYTQQNRLKSTNKRGGVAARLTQGVSKNLQLSGYASLLLGDGESYNWSHHSDQAAPSETTQELNQDLRNHAIELQGTVDYLLAPNSWVATTLKTSFTRDSRDYSRYQTVGGTVTYDGDTHNDHARNQYGLSVSSMWVSRRVVIPFQQLLDDFQHYYGPQLPGRTFSLSGDVAFDYTELSSHSNSELEDEPQSEANSSGVYKDIILNLHPRYYLRSNFVVSASLDVRRELRDQSSIAGNHNRYHSQTNRTSLNIDYISAKWDPDKRSSVSWNGISDIDYLLGAMLLPGDYRISFELHPPTYQAMFEDVNVGLFDFRQGENDGYWTADLAAAVGIMEDIEIAHVLGYNHYPSLGVGMPNYNRYTFTPRVTVQPTSFARFYFGVTETIYDDYPDIYDYIENGSDSSPLDDDHTWSVDVGVNLII